MFSMSAAVSLDALLQSGALGRVRKGIFASDPRARSSGLADLDRVLPDRGFPPGITELAAPHGMGGASTIALSAIQAAQARDKRVHCAWIEPRLSGTLHAPFVDRMGVSRDRLVVVRPPPEALARVALEVVDSGAFEVVAIRIGRARGLDARHVRKLALLAEERGGIVLIASDGTSSGWRAWPVTLRIELHRAPSFISVKVTRDRRGRTGATGHVVPGHEAPERPARDVAP